MADTLGSLVDKLITADMKMWNNQELIYNIRRMSFDEYKERFFQSEEGAKLLWDALKKACDLNVQRNYIIDEIDQKLVELVSALLNSEDIEGKFIQRKYKTY